MHDDRRYRRIVGLLTLLSAALALACLVVGVVAVEFDFDAFGDPTRTLLYAEHHVLMFWFNILDLFGYYLLLLPVVLLHHQRFRHDTPWMPLITLSGVAYAVIGACGAAILAAVWPNLMRHAVGATGDAPQIIAFIFTTVTIAVTKGLWNIVEMVFAATWWIGCGIIVRSVSPMLAWLSLLTGIACVANLLGNLSAVRVVSDIGLNLYLALAIVWAATVGIYLLRASRDNLRGGGQRSGCITRRDQRSRASA